MPPQRQRIWFSINFLSLKYLQNLFFFQQNSPYADRNIWWKFFQHGHTSRRVPKNNGTPFYFIIKILQPPLSLEAYKSFTLWTQAFKEDAHLAITGCSLFHQVKNWKSGANSLYLISSLSLASCGLTLLIRKLATATCCRPLSFSLINLSWSSILQKAPVLRKEFLLLKFALQNNFICVMPSVNISYNCFWNF